MNQQERGKCTICGQSGIMMRKYYYYDVDCDCCGGTRHFEIVHHHENCIPRPPSTIKIALEIQPEANNND